MSEALTNREQEVYNYLLEGLNYKEIADRLIVGQSTAVTHITNVYLKRCVGSRAELMAQRIKELEAKLKEVKGAIS